MPIRSTSLFEHLHLFSYRLYRGSLEKSPGLSGLLMMSFQEKIRSDIFKDFVHKVHACEYPFNVKKANIPPELLSRLYAIYIKFPQKMNTAIEIEKIFEESLQKQFLVLPPSSKYTNLVDRIERKLAEKDDKLLIILDCFQNLYTYSHPELLNSAVGMANQINSSRQGSIGIVIGASKDVIPLLSCPRPPNLLERYPLASKVGSFGLKYFEPFYFDKNGNYAPWPTI